MDRATETGLWFAAVLVDKGGAVQRLGTLVGVVLPVAHRQCLPGVIDAQQHWRPVGRPGGVDGVLQQMIVGLLTSLHKLLRAGDLDPTGAAHHDGLEVLGTHHRAVATAARRSRQVAHRHRDSHLVLARRADSKDLRCRIAHLLPQNVIRLPHVLAPDMAGVSQFHHVVVDIQIDRLFGASLDDDCVVAGVLEFGAKVTASVAIAENTSDRGAGHRDGHTARTGGQRAAQRARPDADHIAWVVGVGDSRVKLIVQDLGVETPTAQEHPRKSGIQWFLGDGPRGQIHSQYLTCPTVHYLFLLLSLQAVKRPSALSLVHIALQRQCNVRKFPLFGCINTNFRRTAVPQFHLGRVG